MTESSPTDGERGPFDAEEFARDMKDSIDLTDWAVDSIEDRISAIEEIIAAGWPRSMFLRRRLARELRASVAGISEATAPGVGAGFRSRRAEATGQDIVLASLGRKRRRREAGR